MCIYARDYKKLCCLKNVAMNNGDSGMSNQGILSELRKKRSHDALEVLILHWDYR